PSHSVFFFFQAEDGIRDFHVTGVQTCALPISLLPVNCLSAIESFPFGCGRRLYLARIRGWKPGARRHAVKSASSRPVCRAAGDRLQRGVFPMIQLKSPREIEQMKVPGRMNAEVLAIVREHCVDGVTTYDLDRIAEEETIKRGGRTTFKGYRGFPA